MNVTNKPAYNFVLADLFLKISSIRLIAVISLQVKNNGVKPSTKLFIDQVFQSCIFVLSARFLFGKITVVI